MNDTLLGAIIGVGGVLLGVVLTSAVNWRQGRAREQQERRGVRLLLRLESAQNLQALSEFWDKVVSTTFWEIGVGYSPEEEEFHNRQRLATVPMPVWGHLMWESQAGLMAMALYPTEIERVYRLHTDLEMFSAMRAKLQEAFDTPEGKQLAAGYAEWMVSRRQQQQAMAHSTTQQMYAPLRAFNEQTNPFWAECLAIYNRAQQLDNLIPEEAPVRRVADWLKRVSRLRLTWAEKETPK